MKNPKVLGIIVLLTVIMISLISCTSSTESLKGMYEGATYNIAIAAKDFEILGVVRIKTTVIDKENGEYITYDALLKEAEAKGGNGIVNVFIDREINSDSETYYGTALAIKYTNTLAPNTPISRSTTVRTPYLRVLSDDDDDDD